jgi:hypothetical protein
VSQDPSAYEQGEAQTLQGLLAEYEGQGFCAHFGAREGGRIHCFSCGVEFAPSDVDLHTIRRLEGASDPADMLAVVPIVCPRCGTSGTLVLGYGPDAALEDSEVLVALPAADHPPSP